MPDDLIRLSYVSTLRPNVTAAEIDQMIEQVAVRNMENGITGVLAIEGDRICQIIEGSAHAVDELYAMIQQDDRHQGVVQIVRQPVATLSFDNWGMVRRGMTDLAIYALTR